MRGESWLELERLWASVFNEQETLRVHGVKNRASLPDAAFAVIDTSRITGKDKEGRSKPDTARHLPHHGSSVKSATENTSVDKALLRNALARMNQIKASDVLKAKARRHLIAHARILLPTTKFKEK